MFVLSTVVSVLHPILQTYECTSDLCAPHLTFSSLSQVMITIYWLGRHAHLDTYYSGPQLNFKAFEGLLGLPLSKVSFSSKLLTQLKSFFFYLVIDINPAFQRF